MNRATLQFDRPEHLAATRPRPARDVGRLMVSTPAGHRHAHFYDLPDFLRSGDLLVTNRSATLAASLAAHASFGCFRLNLSTHYGDNLWLAEPRYSPSKPGPVLSVNEDAVFTVEDRVQGRFLRPYPGIRRLWFVKFSSDVQPYLAQAGEPIRYAYVEGSPPLADYQTLFADTPGSAEMPSAAYPFTRRVVKRLAARGVELAKVTLHTGVSSLEVEAEQIEEHVLYPEPFEVTVQAAQRIADTRSVGGRVIAVGTTVVRALESAWDGQSVRAMRGFTRLYVHPGRQVNAVDGLLTGLHDPLTSHLAMLYAIASKDLIDAAYREAVAEGYGWHEFGDSHLIVPE